jgi:hypothetical protein
LIICVGASGVPEADGVNHLHGVVHFLVHVIEIELICTDLRRRRLLGPAAFTHDADRLSG